MVSKLVHSVAVTVLLWLLAPGFAFAQQVEPSEANAPAEAAETRPIPTGQIAERALDVGDLLRSAALDSQSGREVEAIRADASSTKRQIDELQDETRRRLETGGPVSLIEESEKEWSRLQSRLDRWLKTLSARADAVGSVLQRVSAEKTRWELTRDALSAEETPPELIPMIGEVLDAIEKSEQQVRSSRDSLINLQMSVGDAKSLADEILADQREEIRERNRNVIHRDSDPLWAAFGKQGEGGGLLEEVAAAGRDNYGSLQKYVPEQKTRLLWYLFALVALVAGLIYLRRKAQVWVQQDRSLESALNLLERPVAAGVILAALLADLLHPDAPRAWSAVLGLLLLFALLRLLPQVLVTTGRSWTYILVALFFLQQTAKLTPDGTISHRLVLLLLSLVGFGASLWLVRKMRSGRSDISSGWLQVIRVVARVAAVAFLVGAVANVAGAVGFAMVVVTGTLRAIFGAVILLVAATLMRALVRGAMLLPSVRRLGIVSQRGETTRKTLFRAITVLAVIVWIVVTLQGFNALDPLLDSLGALVEMKISIGEMTLTPGNALIFALVIWVSFKVARFIPFALETDILPHMKLQRGVPAAVTKLTRYALIVIGVIIAFSAAGFPLTGSPSSLVR